ncbi:MAG TPA: excinuclease ABC subunit UvrC [Patescibacteria group bacterium]|nr:excinuclease ABC subunit UvrC [Patescibacteria group bacterium]
MKRKVSKLPDSPGVYFMRNRRGRIIYVGKAKKLSSRVRNYVQKYRTLDPKTQALVSATDDIDYIATRNEVEALVLECNLIKEYRPRYNIRLKDDKRYPFIKLTRNERFPRLLVVRKIENDGAEYFGPYTDARAVRRTLRLIGSIFPLRTCSKRRFGGAGERECLNFHIKRCLGPCTGNVSEREYSELVRQVRLFLRGKNEKLVEMLRRRMKTLAGALRYEEAAMVRNQIEALETLAQRQLAAVPGFSNEDIVALAREGTRSCGVVMKIREGKILGSETFVIPAAGTNDPDGRVYEAFFELYYHVATDIPRKIYTQHALADPGLHERWLGGRTGSRVKIVNPRRGDKKKLIELAGRNAWFKITAETARHAKASAILGEVKECLGLASTPFRIEAYDISNIQGSDAVGAMVTFENGAPRKSDYRHFRIRNVKGIDDFAMLEEVLVRRLSHIAAGKEKRPDLVLVDGGAGQVTAARRAMETVGVTGIPIIGLAKRNEELYREGHGGPLRLPRRSPVLRFFQRIRDEVHRFAVTYHRALRSKGISRSMLDDIPGIGERRKLLLLSTFGSVERIMQSQVEEIASVPGIGGKLAAEIHRYLHR